VIESPLVLVGLHTVATVAYGLITTNPLYLVKVRPAIHHRRMLVAVYIFVCLPGSTPVWFISIQGFCNATSWSQAPKYREGPHVSGYPAQGKPAVFRCLFDDAGAVEILE
jgi:hypothetical protein